MKYKAGFLFLIASPIASLLLIATTQAQTTDPQAANDAPRQIALARCAYTHTGSDCPGASNSTPPATESSGDTLAQIPRRIPGPPMRPRPMGYPRGGYPSMWAGEHNGRHALIGAAIGFGLGAAFGAKLNTDHTPGTELRATLLFGAIGGLIGTAVGSGLPPYYARISRPHRGSDCNKDRDEDQVASGSPQDKTSAIARAQPSSINPDPPPGAPDPVPPAATP